VEKIIREHGLPVQLFADLLDAFSQDVTQKRYQNYLRCWITAGARPIPWAGCCSIYSNERVTQTWAVGRHLLGAAAHQPLARTSTSTTAKDNRVYLPQDDMARFGVSERHLEKRSATAPGRP
jgi:phytoene synthase